VLLSLELLRVPAAQKLLLDLNNTDATRLPTARTRPLPPTGKTRAPQWRPPTTPTTRCDQRENPSDVNMSAAEYADYTAVMERTDPRGRRSH